MIFAQMKPPPTVDRSHSTTIMIALLPESMVPDIVIYLFTEKHTAIHQDPYMLHNMSHQRESQEPVSIFLLAY